MKSLYTNRQMNGFNQLDLVQKGYLQEDYRSFGYMFKQNSNPLFENIEVNLKQMLNLLSSITITKNPEMYKKLLILGLSLEQLFGDHMISAFTKLFNSEVIFRIWDLMFLYSNDPEDYKVNLLLVSVCYQVLVDNQDLLMKCETKSDVLLTIKTYCQFNMYIDKFIKNILSQFNTIQVKYEQYRPDRDTVYQLPTNEKIKAYLRIQ